MRRLSLVLLLVLAVAGLGYGVSELQRGFERARRAETHNHNLTQRMESATGRIDELQDELTRRGEELRTRIEQNQELGRQLAEATSRIEELHGQSERVLRERNEPMPTLVRETLATLAEFLRAAQRSDLRFLRASTLDGRALHDVELVHRSPDGFGATTYFADLARFELNRADSSLSILLSNGTAHGDDEGEFGEDGRRIVVADLEIEDWEEAMPLLMVAVGEAPAEEPGFRPDLDQRALSDWRRRLDRLLGAVVGSERWQVARVRGLVDSGFHRLVLVGKDGTRVLTRSLEAEYATIEIDAETETVCLLLRNGFLRRNAGTTRIPQSGMRIPLPGVTPESAQAEMLGYFERR